MISELQALDAAKAALVKYCASPDPAQPKPQPVCAYRVYAQPGMWDYYLVIAKTELRTTYVLQIDADDASLMSITPLSESSTYQILSKDEALRILRGQTAYPDLMNARLVWHPCRESANPIYPFYEFTSDGKHVYVDMNGRIYSELTPLAFGG